HPDYFSNIEDVFSAFQQMAMQVNKAIIAFGDDEHLQKIQAEVPVIFYGFSERNDFQARNLQTSSSGTKFDVYVRNDFHDTFEIPSFGDHNVLNALSVIALCHYEDINTNVVKRYLKTFQGVKRRFTEKKVGNQVLVDDYAHHPVEIKATINAARQKYPNSQIVAVFQPHTFTRTQAFLQEFGESLGEADKVYLCEIFGSARENHGKLSINDLKDKINGAEILNEEDTSPLLMLDNSVLLFMGAGDIQKFQSAYESLLQQRLKKAQ